MIDAVSSIAAYAMQREQLSMTLMKQRVQAEAAMAQMLMDAAKNIERIAGSSSGPQGSIIDIYV
jgi:propanediol dehydratase small subunit